MDHLYSDFEFDASVARSQSRVSAGLTVLMALSFHQEIFGGATFALGRTGIAEVSL
jgi:hypothetical protein